MRKNDSSLTNSESRVAKKVEKKARKHTSIFKIGKRDSLLTISNFSGVSMLHIANITGGEIIPGSSIDIPNNDIQIDPNPIDSQIFDPESPINGLLLLKEGHILFHPYDKKVNPIDIDLLGLISTKIDRHPCEIALDDEALPEDGLSLLTVNYLDPPKSTFAMKQIVFAGKLFELTSFSKKCTGRSVGIQDSQNFHPPPEHHFQSIRDCRTKVFKLIPDLVLHGSSQFMNQELLRFVRKSLPKRLRDSEWWLRYSLSIDGSSYTTFETNVRNADLTVLLLKISDGSIIGAYVGKGFKTASQQFLGGETCVFSVTPEYNSYPWAKTIAYYISSSRNGISIAGSDSAAIWIDGKFLNGFSEKCLSFNSPSLTSEPMFKISDMEVWEIGGVHLR